MSEKYPDRRLMEEIAEFAYHIRRHALAMVHVANSSHIGGSLSCVEAVAVLYHHVLNVKPDDPDWADRDRFTFSKGHCCVSLYAALAMKGFFPVSELAGYAQLGSRLMGHASHKIPGVEWSTGSLGHGLGFSCGQALAAKRKKCPWNVYTLLSDGEMDEGSTWEAILFAGHHRLDNFIAIIDHNKQQALGYTRDILDLGSLGTKLESFGWATCDVDGHDVGALIQALDQGSKSDKPFGIVSHTTKGKGVAYMEDNMAWHYKAPKTQEELDLALKQLQQSYEAEWASATPQ